MEMSAKDEADIQGAGIGQHLKRPFPGEFMPRTSIPLTSL